MPEGTEDVKVNTPIALILGEGEDKARDRGAEGEGARRPSPRRPPKRRRPAAPRAERAASRDAPADRGEDLRQDRAR